MTPHGLPVRERTLVISGLVLITVVAWGYMWSLARDPMAICMVNMNPWSATDLFALFLMWTVMMAAMMIPSASPIILAFAGVNCTRRAQSLSYVPTSAFVLGYLASWTGYSLMATVAQQAFHSAALISAVGVSTSQTLGGLLLVATGIFQWTPLKNACLRHCRSPLGFLLTEWREGTRSAFQMGLRHGTYCIGCCWLLMALLFVAGVMNLAWVAAIAAFILIEKVGGSWVVRASGLVLTLWGGWMLARVLL
jgi:predicted metal-binding membrane protein